MSKDLNGGRGLEQQITENGSNRSTPGASVQARGGVGGTKGLRGRTEEGDVSEVAGADHVGLAGGGGAEQAGPFSLCGVSSHGRALSRAVTGCLTFCKNHSGCYVENRRQGSSVETRTLVRGLCGGIPVIVTLTRVGVVKVTKGV